MPPLPQPSVRPANKFKAMVRVSKGGGAALICGWLVLALQSNAFDDAYRQKDGALSSGAAPVPAVSSQSVATARGLGGGLTNSLDQPSTGSSQSWASVFRPLEEIAPATPVLDPFATKAALPVLVALAQAGNSTAALSIHQLVSLCSPSNVSPGPAEGCEDLHSLPLPPSTWQPLYWLHLAASLDDPRAGPALLEAAYASSASGSGAEHLNALASAALRALEQSAMRGSLESIELLAQIYHESTLVSPNVALEYAYTDAYAKAARDPVAADRANHLMSGLRAADRAIAQDLQARLLHSASVAQ